MGDGSMHSGMMVMFHVVMFPRDQMTFEIKGILTCV